MNPSNRFKQAREELGLKQHELGDRLGYKQTKIKDLEIGKQKISPEISELMEKIFSISGWWLLTGKGSMLIDNNIEESRAFPLPSLSKDLDYIILDKNLYEMFTNNANLKAFKMPDKSMETYITKDAWIIIDTSVHNFTKRGYYLIEENLEQTIRYITKNKDILELNSHNPQLTQNREATEVKIVGLVVHVIR
jgi:transcriptional regulator with XRE-family HTH domain